MKTLITALGAVIGSLTCALALSITPESEPKWTLYVRGNPDAEAIADLVGTECDLVEVYKQDVGNESDTGSFAANYTTTFDNTPSDPQDATIKWDGGAFIVGGEIYLHVKDGNARPNNYVFDISAWNGTDTINLTGFWPGKGAISHVSILTCPTTSVPDGGATLVLLGLGALGLWGAHRRMSR